MRFLTAIAIFLAVAMLALPSVSHARDKQYNAKQINFKADGVLNEWGDSDVMALDQLKDVGAALPDPKDFSGSAMVGWNSSDPDRIYFTVTITDSEHQDIHPDNDKYWEDDSTYSLMMQSAQALVHRHSRLTGTTLHCQRLRTCAIITQSLGPH